MSTSAPTLAAPAELTAPRVAPVDRLRGLVMVIMAIDHVRDFVHAGAMNFPPEDLAQTTAAIFVTRWITHFCAPVFMFCAGLGVWFRAERRGTLEGLSSFLVTRGVWLIALEVAVVQTGLFFNFDRRLVFLLVFWALGMSMIALAALIHLPYRVLAAISVGLIAFHNLADSVQATRFGSFAWLWRVFPPDYGFDLWVVYAVTAAVVALLYPICLRFGRLKARRRDWWLSYL